MDGAHRVIHLRFARSYICRRPFRIDPNKIALRLTDEPSGRSIDIPADEHAVIVGATPKSGMLSWDPGVLTADLNFTVPSNLPASMYRVSIDDNGAASNSDTNTPAPMTGGIFPTQVYVPSLLHNDAALETARRDFLNRSVYPRGGLSANCEAPDAGGIFLGLPFDQQFHIITITRSQRDGEIWTLGGQIKNTLDNAALFLSLQPLTIRFAAQRFHPYGGGGGGEGAKGVAVRAALFAVMKDSLKCGSMRVTLSDPWELERAFSFKHPYKRPDWPANFREAIQKHHVIAGMTHEMVAEVFGYPSIYLPIAQLDRVTRWDYTASAPFSSSVIFSGDRVVRYNPPGNLP